MQSQHSGKACCVHLLYSQKMQHCLHILVHYTKTAANQVAHLATKFKLHEKLGEYFLIKLLVYKIFLVHLAYIHYTEFAGETQGMD